VAISAGSDPDEPDARMVLAFASTWKAADGVPTGTIACT
jgi:hypothetical protein